MFWCFAVLLLILDLWFFKIWASEKFIEFQTPAIREIVSLKNTVQRQKLAFFLYFSMTYLKKMFEICLCKNFANLINNYFFFKFGPFQFLIFIFSYVLQSVLKKLYKFQSGPNHSILVINFFNRALRAGQVLSTRSELRARFERVVS